ncbi:MAG: GDCCVxC domain-containing (seleno)protein [Nitrospira sp.]
MGKDDRWSMDVITQSVVTCSRCSVETEKEMSTDACILLLECESCRVALRPKSGVVPFVPSPALNAHPSSFDGDFTVLHGLHEV